MVLHFVGDFSTGNLNQWPNKHLADPARVTVQQSVVREGFSHAARFELPPGARWNGSWRQEVHAGQDNTVGPRSGFIGSERWYGWSWWLPTNWSVPSWLVGSQMRHDNDAGGNPPMGFYMTTSGFNFVVRGGRYTWSPNSSQYGRTFSGITVPKDRWVDVILGAKWHYDPALGWVELWVDGVNVVPRTAISNVYLNPTTGAFERHYFKQGLYGDDDGSTKVIYLTATRIGDTRAEVTPNATTNPEDPDPPPPSGPAPQSVTPVTPAEDFASVGGTLILAATPEYPSWNNSAQSASGVGKGEWVELVSPPASGGPSCVFDLRTGAQTGYRALWVNGQIRVYAMTNYLVDEGTLATLPYDAAAHRWLRWRHVGSTATDGTVHFDTSPDGLTWTQRHWLTNTKDLTTVYTYLNAGASGAETTPAGSAIWDNHNVVAGGTTPVHGQIRKVDGTGWDTALLAIRKVDGSGWDLQAASESNPDPEPEPEPEQPTPNTVYARTFDTDLGGWSARVNATLAWHSSGAARATATTSSLAAIRMGLANAPAVTSGTSYTVRAVVTNRATAGRAFDLQTVFTDSTGNIVTGGQTFQALTTIAAGATATLTFTITAPSGAVRLEETLRSKDALANEQFDLSEITVVTP